MLSRWQRRTQSDRYVGDMTFFQNAWYVAAWQQNALKHEDTVVWKRMLADTAEAVFLSRVSGENSEDELLTYRKITQHGDD